MPGAGNRDSVLSGNSERMAAGDQQSDCDVLVWYLHLSPILHLVCARRAGGAADLGSDRRSDQFAGDGADLAVSRD